LGSVHLDGVQLALSVHQVLDHEIFKGSPAHVGTLTGPTTLGWYPAGYAATTSRERSQLSRISRRLSATGIRFLGILSRRGIPPLLRSAYQHKTIGPSSAGPG